MGTPAPQSTEPERATKVRFAVLTYLCLLTFILYLDRVCISQLAITIQTDLKLTDPQLGYVFSAFTLSYGIFMAAAGRLGDRFGSRAVLVGIVLWWSFFTGLTGACTGLIMLLVVRFIFGAGEAGALPNCARILGRWFPAEARGMPQGLLNTSALVGGALAPFVVVRTMNLLDQQLASFFLREFGAAPVGWRWTFVIFGSVGLVWAVFFWFRFRDEPETHPNVNTAERDYIRRGRVEEDGRGPQPVVPWRLVLISRNVWLMGLIVSCASFASYTYMFWCPKYLHSGRAVNEYLSGDLASLVLAGGAIGSLLGGLLSDYVTRITGGLKRSRSLIGSFSLGSSGLLLLASLGCKDATTASFVMALAFLLGMVQIASWWGVVSDISGKHVGTLFGLMNSIGIIGGIAAQNFFGLMADYNAKRGLVGRAQWDPALYYVAAVLFLGSIAWLFVNSNRSAVEEPEIPVID